MKTVKKVAAVFVCLAMAVVLAIPAFAAGLDTNKQKVLDAVSAAVVVNGKSVVLPADMLTQVENYLKRDDVTITDAQVAAIQQQVTAAQDVVKASGVSSISSLPGADKTKILAIAQTAAKAVNLTVSVNSANSTVTVLDNKGTVVASMEPALKVTGPDTTAVAVFGVLALVLMVGCAIVAFKAKLAVK